MQNNIIIGALIIIVIGVVGFMSVQPFSASKAGIDSAYAATIYKSPTCGCCGQYAAYLKGEGYDVDIELVEDMALVKEQYGVPYDLESCHTMETYGYIVEGHIPNEAIQKLVTEKPDIKGIGMAGMPSGAPGMPGPKRSEFVIYEITHDGKKGDVFITI